MHDDFAKFMGDCCRDMPFSITIIMNEDLKSYSCHVIKNRGNDNEESAVIHDLVLGEEDHGGLRYL